jgi:5-methylcytosine-specific restriction endonuclease McrA
MKRVSSKRAIQNKIRKELRNELIRERGPECQIGMTVICTGIAQDMHEILSRARGGSIIDPANILLVCRRCHSWITENPNIAAEIGASRRSSDDETITTALRDQHLPVWRKKRW